MVKLFEIISSIKTRFIKQIWIEYLLKNKFHRLLKNNKSIKLHLGCGKHILKDWINIDNGMNFNNFSELDFSCDLRYGIPCDDNLAHFIFHEHLIEHLSRAEALEFTQTCRNKLRPGGVLRIAYPDLDMSIKNYQNNYSDFDWYYKIYPKRRNLTNGEIFNLSLRENGLHKHIYNKNDIKKLILESGFQEEDIEFYSPGESHHPELQHIEKREFSVCVECVKHPAESLKAIIRS